MRKRVNNYTEVKVFITQAHEAGQTVHQDMEFCGAILTTETIQHPELNLYENGGCMKEVKTALDVKF
ncbi:MAG: hypothetical protein NC489_26135 [Ruminococcus flavefaciens]|nr:hypothetical protein [Ruminococcus flavefaciens]